MGRRILLLLLILLVPTLASAQPAEELPTAAWIAQSLRELAKDGWLPEDMVGEGLTRQRAAQLVAEVIQSERRIADGKGADELNGLLAEFRAELTGMGIQLDRLANEITAARDAASQKKSQMGIWSEARGYLDIKPGNGGSPRIFNAIRIKPQIDSDTRLSMMLYIQNGLGTKAYDTLVVNIDEFYLSTKAKWKSQSINFTVGNFFIARTPFTIYRFFRKEDINKEARRSFNGIQASTRLWGLNWQGFVARLADGNGVGFDRYMLFNYASTPISGGEGGLTLLRVADDLGSNDKTQGGYASTTVGINLRHRGKLQGINYELTGEGNLNRKDADVRGGPEASTNWAARLEGKLELKTPLSFHYYAISRGYPIDHTAIQALSDGFLYQYEENPYEPYYLTNIQRFEFKANPLRLGSWGQLIGTWNRAQEIKALQENTKNFGYLGLDLTVDPAKLVPLSFVSGSKLDLTIGDYRTFRLRDLDLSQKVAMMGLSRQVLANLNLTCGYELFKVAGQDGDAQCNEKTKIPFLKAIWTPLRGSTLEWRYDPQTVVETERITPELITLGTLIQKRHKVEFTSTIGPSTNLTLRFDQISVSDSIDRSISINYRSGF